ncbi:MAG: hypothetical protein ACRED2_13460, partial [Methylocella sp.]
MIAVPKCRKSRAAENIAIVTLLGYSNRRGLKSRDFKKTIRRGSNAHNLYYGTTRGVGKAHRLFATNIRCNISRLYHAVMK